MKNLLKTFSFGLMLALCLVADAWAFTVQFSPALPVWGTPAPAANILNDLSLGCETSVSGFIVDVSMLNSPATCTAANVFGSPGSATVLRKAIHAGTIAASSSSMAHAYLTAADGAPFELLSFNIVSYATATDKKINQWYLYGEEADGTPHFAQFSGKLTAVSLTGMSNLKYLHLWSLRGGFDLYNVQVQ